MTQGDDLITVTLSGPLITGSNGSISPSLPTNGVSMKGEMKTQDTDLRRTICE